jgi:hypothetical protein
MSNNDKKVNDFLDNTMSLYGFAPLTDLKRRELKFKLALADIKDTVKNEDFSLALDLILSEMEPKTGSVKIAHFSGGASKQTCPRCSSVMCGVKISATSDAMYCSSCHVTVPVR